MNARALEREEPQVGGRRSDVIAGELEAMIVAGEFASGERLDETRLAARFHVSRTPLREALRRLETSGLIEVVPRRGAFVRRIEPHEMVEMFEVMAELEALAGRLAARRGSAERLEWIGRLCAECERAIGSADSYYEANERFHHAIYEASGNAFLQSEAKHLHRRLRPFRRLQLRVRGRLQQSADEHRAIVAALRAGDEEATAAALRGHIAIQGKRFSDFLATVRELGDRPPG